MSDYKAIHEELDRAISLLMSSVFERPAGHEGNDVSCDWAPFMQGVMQVARTSQWAAGLHEAHQMYAEVPAKPTTGE